MAINIIRPLLITYSAPARHIASATDVKQAYAVGRAAVKMALAGKTAVMAGYQT